MLPSLYACSLAKLGLPIDNLRENGFAFVSWADLEGYLSSLVREDDRIVFLRAMCEAVNEQTLFAGEAVEEEE